MIRLLIVDRLQAMCESMVAVLREELDIEVVGVATTPEQALAQLPGCDMVLVTASLPGDETRDFIRAVARINPCLQVVAMDVPDGRDAASPYVEAGAVDCLLESESIEDLLSKLRAIHYGAPVAQLMRM